MKNRILSGLFAAICATTAIPLAHADESFSFVEKKAMAGDYQAQRNIAYGYASYPYPGQVKNPVMACAWYLVVLHSGSPKAGDGDVGNVSVYCGNGKLDGNSQELAKVKARALYKSIYKAQPQF